MASWHMEMYFISRLKPDIDRYRISLLPKGTFVNKRIDRTLNQSAMYGKKIIIIFFFFNNYETWHARVIDRFLSTISP